ncbi:MAG: thermonuclease family protein [Terracoccus sp.]
MTPPRPRPTTHRRLGVLALLPLAILGACGQGAGAASAPAPAPATATATATTTTTAAVPTPVAPRPVTWTVTKIVDGDTIWATRAGERVKVRLIGIDTPETGQCGFTAATDHLRAVIAGRPVTLTPGARDDVDRYGRVLRYVDVAGTDAGLSQISDGLAVARYDSRDGYGRHARESAYVRADAIGPSPSCPTAAPTPPMTAPSIVTPHQPTAAPETPDAVTEGWPPAGDRHPCPQTEPIKGNEPSMIAHSPGQQSYLVTNPEQCFSTLAAAAAAGFRPARR